MALYVVPIPNPAAGADWQTTVPGQYIYDITGITATLDTSNLPSYPIVDSSGNGYSGTIQLDPPATADQVFSQPGLVPGDTSMRFGETSIPVGYAFGHVPGPINHDLGQSFTVEFLAQAEPFPQSSLMGFYRSGAFQVSWLFNADGTIQVNRTGDSIVYQCVGPFLFDGNPHLIDIVLPFAGDFVVYVDGVATALNFQTAPGSRAVGPVNGYDFFIGGGGPQVYETIDEFALYGSALSAGQVATRQAARGTFAGYTASVLGDTPLAYYHLDETGGTGRQVSLTVTDGTNPVLNIPSGFPVATTTGPYTYSWQPNLNSSTQTPGGKTTTVAIPRLILPAGYTVGTVTGGLIATDQWSNINLWWSDDVQQAIYGVGAFDYGDGVHLKYRQEANAP